MSVCVRQDKTTKPPSEDRDQRRWYPGRWIKVRRSQKWTWRTL